MKLLTTIAAVLISISAFSQDLIEYDNGTFTQNGEELSMEQINDLTALHKAGKGNVRRANRFDRMHKDRNLRISNNGLNFIGGAASGVVGVFSLGSAVWLYSLEEDFHGRQATALGAVFCVVSYKAFLSTVSKEMCLPKRDEQFNKVADKLNEAIKAANQ
jgi:hypothetical protein